MISFLVLSSNQSTLSPVISKSYYNIVNMNLVTFLVSLLEEKKNKQTNKQTLEF